MKNIAKESSEHVQGFTLVEVVIALTILALGILSLYSMQLSSIRANATASTITSSANWAADRIENLLNLPYDHAWLDDVNGDGTNRDLNFDGVDDTAGANFGLDNDTTVTADHWAESPDRRYTIVWNIAVDLPARDMKTIRVIVATEERGLTKQVPMTFMVGK